MIHLGLRKRVVLLVLKKRLAVGNFVLYRRAASQCRQVQPQPTFLVVSFHTADDLGEGGVRGNFLVREAECAIFRLESLACLCDLFNVDHVFLERDLGLPQQLITRLVDRADTLHLHVEQINVRASFRPLLGLFVDKFGRCCTFKSNIVSVINPMRPNCYF